MDNSPQPDSKVLFRVVDEDGSANVETLWATHLGANDYKLDNSPFYAYGVSWEDVVLAPFDAEEGFPMFERVVAKSGNRTVRVIFRTPLEEGNDSDRMLRDLVALGCSYEGANRKYFSVNIPPSVDLNSVRAYLIDRRQRGSTLTQPMRRCFRKMPDIDRTGRQIPCGRTFQIFRTPCGGASHGSS